mmetsp:Transcript_97865/g.210994  ORF Transcript_97865/g.210994 Transcript_97865/m.210994 type:complete len:140 (+) Transcript_97865:40-459(+)
MTELANEFSGASVLSASSFDLKHPPSSVIDGEYNTFWLTTGAFPQEIVIQLGEPSIIKGVELVSCGIRNVQLSKCEGAQANTWENIAEEESQESDSEIQKISIQAPPRITAQYLRIKILSGWADCVSLFKVSVLGTAKR